MDIVHQITLKRHKSTQKNQVKENFGVGDTVTVYVRVREGEKERLQAFKGVVIKVQGAGLSRSFTVRKMSAGVGVERTFPVNCPSIDEIEIMTKGNIRRARLYFLRNLRGKAARINSEMAKAMGLDEETIKAQESAEAEAKAAKLAAKEEAAEDEKTEKPQA